MKTKMILSFGVVAALALTAFTIAEEPNEILEIGAVAPMSDYKMTAVTEKQLSINDIKGENGALVIFSCNTCPFVVGNGSDSEGWEGRYTEIQIAAAEAGVGMILVNSNEAKREGDDSLEAMKEHAKARAYRSHYVVDTNHQLADAFGALTTPHVFLFDKELKLVYKGAIDDNVSNSKEVKEEYLKNALTNLKAGKAIEPNSTRQLGCSIKRVKK